MLRQSVVAVCVGSFLFANAMYFVMKVCFLNSLLALQMMAELWLFRILRHHRDPRPTSWRLNARRLSLAWLFCLLLGAGNVLANTVQPFLMLWDNAIVDNKYDLSKSDSIQFVYTNDELKAGDWVVPLIPMDPGFTVLCCVEVAESKRFTLDELRARYPDSLAFARRLKSLQGVRYAYQTKFVPEKEMSPAMRRISKGSGETYYSAPALLGKSSLKHLDKNTFSWSDWGDVSLVFKNPRKGLEEYRLNHKNGVSVIRVESLPD